MTKFSDSLPNLAIAMASFVLSGCALDPMGSNGSLTSNASKVYIYTASDRAGMSPDGITNRILLPSEVRSFMENKDGPPTGEVNYCDAGLAQLVQARRAESLAAIAAACGGDDKYRVRREGPGNVKAHYFGNFQISPSCTRSRAIVFKCTGAEPKPNMDK
jgi:hypothetical protein